MAVKVEKIEFAGWKNCVRLSDAKLELIVTTDVGPRIISACTPGGANMMCVAKEEAGITGGDEWRSYGGHRLWHSPEDYARTYVPDNSPVEWREIEDGIALSSETEGPTGIKKEMEVTISKGQARINHRLTNLGVWPVELAVWAITVVDAGGMEIMPLPPKGNALLPSYPLVVWPYVDLNDPRLSLGKNYMTLTQDVNCAGPMKIGYPSAHGWAAYCLNGDLFVKRFTPEECDCGCPYPDFGCSYETYTNNSMLEMETLTRMCVLNPGESKEHIELWNIYEGVERPGPADEAAIDALVKRYIDG